jgi:hypothetical protein
MLDFDRFCTLPLFLDFTRRTSFHFLRPTGPLAHFTSLWYVNFGHADFGLLQTSLPLPYFTVSAPRLYIQLHVSGHLFTPWNFWSPDMTEAVFSPSITCPGNITRQQQPGEGHLYLGIPPNLRALLLIFFVCYRTGREYLPTST